LLEIRTGCVAACIACRAGGGGIGNPMPELTSSPSEGAMNSATSENSLRSELDVLQLKLHAVRGGLERGSFPL
jgi:hypothetical protein